MTEDPKEKHDRILDFVFVDASDETEVGAEDVATFAHAIGRAKAQLARQRLKQAKAGAAGYRPPSVASLDLERARRELKQSGTAAAPITLAARFGDGSMDEDMDALLEDLAELSDDEE
jgi:hypothetical protein